MKDKKFLFGVFGGLIFVTLALGALVWFTFTSVQRTISPMQAMTSNLNTQVAKALNPTPTILPDPVTIIHSVRSLARLETIQYSVEKVITAEVDHGVLSPLFGDKLLLIARGYVIAGVDLTKLRPEDLVIKNNVLYVNLPEPEIFVATLDNEKSYVYDRETGVLTKGSVQLESDARRVAQQEIEKAALEDGILEQARINAENYLYLLFQELGFPDIIFLPPEVTPTPSS